MARPATTHRHAAITIPAIVTDIAAAMDLRWFLVVDPEVARERLVRRHVEAGICGSEEEARDRVERNDFVNGDLIRSCRVDVDRDIVCVEDKNVAAAAGE